MKSIYYLAICYLLSNGFKCIAQSPANDPHWEQVKYWNFKTISWSDFTNDWNIAPCVRSLDFGDGYVEPQYYSGNNVSQNTDGMHLTVKSESVYDEIICYEPDSYF